MIDFKQARANMVESQIRCNDVTDHNILRAFLAVPREAFVGAEARAISYIDEDLLVSSAHDDRYLMEPMSIAKLLQLADIEKSDIVLDVGCATGYSTAVLSHLCTSVVALEVDKALAEQATTTLHELGVDNAVVVQGALDKGHAKEGPYDVIFIGGSVEEVPSGMATQLKEGGRLVVVEGRGNAGRARLYVKQGDIFAGRDAFNSAVQPLPGFDKALEFVF